MVNSAASFVRLIKKALAGTEEIAHSFIDDIIIFSDSWNLNLVHIEFLAHMVGNGELKPTDEKVKAVQEFPVPTTKRKVRSLIGFLNFYRMFIPGFAQKAAHITDLTSKSAKNKLFGKLCCCFFLIGICC